MTPSWYDVLDVEPDASTEEIRTAWRTALADLDPTDRRFRSLNRAAEVLLDPQRREEHDAVLARERALEDADETDSETGSGDDVAHEPAGPVAGGSTGDDAGLSPRRPRRGRRTTVVSPPAEAPTEVGAGATVIRAEVKEPHPTPRSRSGLVAVTAALTVLAIILVAATVLAAVRRPQSTLPTAADVAAAQAAAETAIVPVLSYDYKDLSASESAATSYLTPDFAKEYRQYFAATVLPNAAATKTVVRATVVDSGIVRTGPGRVDVLMYVNQPQTNKARSSTFLNQVTARMEDVDGRWLVGCLITTLDGVCGQP